MAYAIRNREYRYIVNMKYDAGNYVPIWSEQVSQQLYSCAPSDNPAALICDETINLAEPTCVPALYSAFSFHALLANAGAASRLE